MLGQAPPADDGQYLVTTWTTEEGLPQNSVTSIIQTRDGYLWLATFGGLARFDGVRFTLFTSTLNPGLRSNRIHCLAEDRDGALWVGTGGGGLARFKDGAFTSYTTQQGLPSNTVNAFYQDRAGTFWVGTEGGLTRIRDGASATYTVRDGLPDNNVGAIAEDDAGRLWLGTHAGLARLESGAITPVDTGGHLPTPWISILHRSQDGAIWLSAGRSLAKIVDGQFDPRSVIDTRSPGPVRSIYEDRDGSLWLGCYSSSEVRRVVGENVVTYGGRQKYNAAVWTAYGDREGNLWFGTNGQGLKRWRRRQIITYTTEDGLPANTVLPITEDGAGDIWIGTLCGGVGRWRGGRMRPLSLEGWGPGECVRALLADRDGGMWVARGNLVSSLKDGKATTYSAAEGLAPGEIWSLYQDREGAVWVGSAGGLSRFRDGRWTGYREGDGLVNNEVRFITEDREGALWLGTIGGLSRFKDGRFTNYTTAQGLSQNFVRAVYQDAGGTLWVGTYGGGINRMRAGKFTAITSRDGLFDDAVSRILEDERGNFWMSGNKGVFRVSRRELEEYADGRLKAFTCVSYGAGDGMVTGETNGGGEPAGWAARDGRLWFPTITGVVVIDPSQVNALPPPVVIEGLLLDQTPVALGARIAIPPGAENLELHYTALTLSASQKARFRYKLEGYDGDWVEAGARRVAYYTHIPPGAYRFRVLASNNDGVWNHEGAALDLEVIPPFWRTWWFYGLALASLVGLGWLGYRARVAHLKRRHAAQEAFSRQLLASQESERQRIAAELHDGLGQNLLVIKNRALLGLHLRAEHDQAVAQLGEISAAASQAIDEVRAIAGNLHPYQLTRLGLTKAVTAMVNKVAAASQIHFSVEIEAVDGLLDPPAEINLYRIIQESLNNIVKHSHATEASVMLKQEAQSLQIMIRDNGDGFNLAASSGQARGFGLAGMSERARMIGGTQAIHSAPGQGTTVTVKLSLPPERKDGRRAT